MGISVVGFPRLLGDIGGTNARFALQRVPEGPLIDVRALPTRDHESLAAAVEHYLRSGQHLSPVDAAFGIAADPTEGDLVEMTNLGWSFSIVELQSRLRLRRLLVLNDFTALALGLPDLGPTALLCVGDVAPRQWPPMEPLGLIGAGTGLGVSGLIPLPGGSWHALSGEGGHVSLAAATVREEQVIRWLRDRFGHASAERALSGQGLENLYRAVTSIDGLSCEGMPAAEITRRARARSDDVCTEVVDLFCALLGSVAGDLALTLGASGGVYIGGGIVPRLGEDFLRSPFRTRFEAKGRFSAWLSRRPVHVITAPESPALLGAARALSAP